MPPWRAIAIAKLDSVTVSMAAEASGIFSESLRVKQVRVSTSMGKMEDLPGSGSTSSKVRPSEIGPSIIPSSHEEMGHKEIGREQISRHRSAHKTAQPSGCPLGWKRNSSNRKNASP